MLVEIILLLGLGIPVGWFIASLTKDELQKGRKWFIGITTTSFLAGIWFYLIKVTELIWTFLFLAIISFVSYIKSLEKYRNV